MRILLGNSRDAVLSVIESCSPLHIPVRDYLAAILPGTQRPSHPTRRDANIPLSSFRLRPHPGSMTAWAGHFALGAREAGIFAGPPT